MPRAYETFHKDAVFEKIGAEPMAAFCTAVGVAKANVEKRMQFIKKEADRLEHGLKGLETKQAQSQQEIAGLQQKLQKIAQKALKDFEEQRPNAKVVTLTDSQALYFNGKKCKTVTE